jgi:hypothetical protein
MPGRRMATQPWREDRAYRDRYGARMMLIPAGAAARTDRSRLIARAHVWSATSIRSMDLKAGPRGPGSFAPGQTVHCEYREKDFDGASKKFACRLAAGEEVKVKFGIGSGEVCAEVAATRLLWALGFGADRMYPVRVVCRGCPESVGDVVDPAVIERRMAGKDLPDDGWSWIELDLIDESTGGATKAQVDALKLLATFFRHIDSKREQHPDRPQRLRRSASSRSSGSSLAARPCWRR